MTQYKVSPQCGDLALRGKVVTFLSKDDARFKDPKTFIAFYILNRLFGEGTYTPVVDRNGEIHMVRTELLLPVKKKTPRSKKARMGGKV